MALSMATIIKQRKRKRAKPVQAFLCFVESALTVSEVSLRVRLLYIQNVMLRTHKRLWVFAHGANIRLTDFLYSTIHSSIVLLLGLVIAPILKSNLQPSRCLRKNDLRSKRAIKCRVQLWRACGTEGHCDVSFHRHAGFDHSLCCLPSVWRTKRLNAQISNWKPC